MRGTALPRIKGNFFTADLEEVRVAFESVPWVRQAAVRREWPNKLIVVIEEHKPLGTWGEDGTPGLGERRFFTANLAEAEEDGDLPDFNGPAGSREGSRRALPRFRAVAGAGGSGAGSGAAVEPLCMDASSWQRHDGGAGQGAKQGDPERQR